MRAPRFLWYLFYLEQVSNKESGIVVSETSLAARIGMPQLGLGVFDMDDETTATVVATAIEAGYRSIDTAHIYGNERGVGEGIRRSGIDR